MRESATTAGQAADRGVGEVDFAVRSETGAEYRVAGDGEAFRGQRVSAGSVQQAADAVQRAPDARVAQDDRPVDEEAVATGLPGELDIPADGETGGVDRRVVRVFEIAPFTPQTAADVRAGEQHRALDLETALAEHVL